MLGAYIPAVDAAQTTVQLDRQLMHCVALCFKGERGDGERSIWKRRTGGREPREREGRKSEQEWGWIRFTETGCDKVKQRLRGHHEKDNE